MDLDTHLTALVFETKNLCREIIRAALAHGIEQRLRWQI